jgi:hypothetical protein
MEEDMNAIIAAAAGYGEGDLRVFLRSVERNCRKTKVFLIVYDRDRETIASLGSKYEFLEFVPIRNRIRLIRLGFRYLRFSLIARYLSVKDYSSINRLTEVLGRYPLNISVERYFVALELVRAYRNSFSNVLLTDSRDVIIQSDPFSLINEKLVSGVVETTIGTSRANSDWIKKIYGEDILTQMSDRRTVCSGVTLGPSEEVENYLSEMCSEIWRYLPRITYRFGFDQGFHNYLIFEGKFPIDLTDNREGFIATLGHEKPINILKEPATGLVQVHGVHPAIVHQYDHHPDLVEFLKV